MKIKKLLSAALVALFVFSGAQAQDLNEATELYNGAVTALQSKDFKTSLTNMQKAMEIAQAAGDEGAQMVTDCKNLIPTLIMQVAKQEIAAGNFDAALASAQDALAKATEYNNAEGIEDAKQLVPQVYTAQGQSLLKAGNAAGAVEALSKAVEIAPENGVANLVLGQSYQKLGKEAEAVAAFEKAAANGQEKNANKLLQNIYIQKMVAAYKGKKNADAVEAAAKALSYGENPNAYKIGGMAAASAGKNDQAIEWLEKAKADASVNYNLAKAYEAKGNNAKACSYYKLIVTDKNFGQYADAKVKALCK